ncbi:MAG: hypothetical protein RR191_05600 [Cetobacterium sp.]|uniref:hypothetical protein n=1 Tax=Cetobacterium sp. TaxID=2071632 RepID=UPI002FC5ADE4
MQVATAWSKKTQIAFHLQQFAFLKKYATRMHDMRKYLKCNMMGMYEIGFLPKSGGLDEQDWDWVEDVELIISALNRANNT